MNTNTTSFPVVSPENNSYPANTQAAANPYIGQTGMDSVLSIAPDAADNMPYLQENSTAPLVDYTNLSPECPSTGGIASPNCIPATSYVASNPTPQVHTVAPDSPNYPSPNGPMTHPPMIQRPEYETPNLEMVPSPEGPNNCPYGSGQLDCYLNQRVEIQFVLGNSVVEKVGILRGLDAETIVLETGELGNLVIGSINTVKLVTVLAQ